MRALVVAGIFGLVGCGGHAVVDRNDAGVAPPVSAPPSASPPSSPDASTQPPQTATGPYRITCSVYHRDLSGTPPFEHEQVPIVFRSNEPSEKAIEVSTAKIPVVAKLAPTSDPSVTALTLRFPRSGLVQEYMLPRENKPAHDFAGGHGFAGLNYIVTPDTSIDVQYICEASGLDEERPLPPLGPGTEPPTPPPSTPPPRPVVRFRCEATLEGPAPRSETVLIETAGKKEIALGGLRVWVHFQDSTFDGRSLVIQVGTSPERWHHQQLFQGMTYPNQLRGTGALTGRSRLTLGAETASIACSSE